MGTCCETKRNLGFQEWPNTKVDAKDFYDVIVSINSIKDVVKGWNIEYSERFIKNQENLINDKVLKIGIIGNSNKGKSFILSKISKIDLPSGTSISTEGLSIKYPDLKKYKDRRIVLLDSAGLETPVIKSNNNEGEQGNNDKDDLFKEKSREKIITESFLQDYIINNSDFLIIVVGILSYSEQKAINRIKVKLNRENSMKKINETIFVIHNLMTYTTIGQVKSYIKETLLKSETFELKEHIKINIKKKSQTGVCYFEKNSNLNIFHLIYANDFSDAGDYYNQYTLSFLENYFGTKIDLKGFDIIESVKKRFTEVSKDIFEKFEGEIEFENSKNLIKLKNPKELILKKCYIDELGLQNIRANGYEPNYSHYRTHDQIIVKIEAPGKCDLNSSIQLIGEYVIIKIEGNKLEDDMSAKIENNIFNGREFGNFYLEIPIKQEDFYIKNESPIIDKKEGIFKLAYQIEEKKLTGKYTHP